MGNPLECVGSKKMAKKKHGRQRNSVGINKKIKDSLKSLKQY
jgi:hypothetical protein